MKKMLLMLCLATAVSAFAEDIYMKPDKFISGDRFIYKGKTYQINGIKSEPGPWLVISGQVMAAMMGHKEYKFLPVGKPHNGIQTVRLGVYNRAGKHQYNPPLRLLRMGLVKYDRRANLKEYADAEANARQDHRGLWYSVEK